MDDATWDAMAALLEVGPLGSEPSAASWLYEQLDALWGPGGWSCRFQVASVQPPAVGCSLELGGAVKSGVGSGATLEAAAEAALWMAAAQAGVGRPPSAPPGARREAPPRPETAKPSAQELIDRLIARLREAGKGREAAALVVKYGGYGSDPETTKKLYGELRALLLEKEPS
ncbi:MAG TPA: DNA repair protein Rad52 [Oceanithermus profundus]|uniref:DNA repair protein Rad52 n=1 Tax=Oceanithermus profundus TaxID=187137 RepID=A0A7C5WTJ2_9DEIN|nr:DNA repair protein Rad52 [Oceanithermus profundus]